MIQRVIIQAIKDGIAAAKADPDLVSDLFNRQLLLSESEVDTINEWLGANEVDVVQGFPKQNTEFPVVAVMLGDERNTISLIGDWLGIDDETGDHIYGAFWEHTYRCMVFTQHADATTYLYEIIKNALIRATSLELRDAGAHDVKYAGNDLMPDPQYAPEFLFLRQLTITCSTENQYVDTTKRLGRALKVAGIHIDKSGSPGDVGGVKTLVDPVGE